MTCRTCRTCRTNQQEWPLWLPRAAKHKLLHTPSRRDKSTSSYIRQPRRLHALAVDIHAHMRVPFSNLLALLANHWVADDSSQPLHACTSSDTQTQCRLPIGHSQGHLHIYLQLDTLTACWPNTGPAGDSSQPLLASCAGDAEVRLHDLASGARSVFSHHGSRVKKLVTEPSNPHLLLSCSEDGTGDAAAAAVACDVDMYLQSCCDCVCFVLYGQTLWAAAGEA